MCGCGSESRECEGGERGEGGADDVMNSVFEHRKDACLSRDDVDAARTPYGGECSALPRASKARIPPVTSASPSPSSTPSPLLGSSCSVGHLQSRCARGLFHPCLKFTKYGNYLEKKRENKKAKKNGGTK